jgi:hypothetical protein
MRTRPRLLRRLARSSDALGAASSRSASPLTSMVGAATSATRRASPRSSDALGAASSARSRDARLMQRGTRCAAAASCRAARAPQPTPREASALRLAAESGSSSTSAANVVRLPRAASPFGSQLDSRESSPAPSRRVAGVLSRRTTQSQPAPHLFETKPPVEVKTGRQQHYIGIEYTVNDTRTRYELRVTAAIAKIIKDHGVENLPARRTPAPLDLDISELGVRAREDPEPDLPYRAAVGSLMYLAVNARPDIMFVTCSLARYLITTRPTITTAPYTPSATSRARPTCRSSSPRSGWATASSPPGTPTGQQTGPHAGPSAGMSSASATFP